MRRAGSFLERHPVVTGVLLVAGLTLLPVFDGMRLHAAQQALGARAVAEGAALGTGLALLGAAAVRAASRTWGSSGPWWMAPASLWLVVFGLGHPRRGDDALDSRGDVALVLAADVAVLLVLVWLAVLVRRKRSRRPPRRGRR